MSDDEKDYEVGYGKPPKHTRFKKGQSGNPKGRPKGARGLSASLKRELESKITVREGNREIRITKAEAMAKRLAASALKGDSKALLALLKLDADLFGDSEAHDTEAGLSGRPEPVDYDILRDFFSSPQAGQEDVEDQEDDCDGT
ncbi:DUF5681 domain-containing protein [Ruegeria arenilitoris]|uniref:DUF5681 domain-containing protein n=1 Tax=Ruegeria arenilitoris TaxID=1173585 RepID=UPI00147EFB63|nr:DUF5681 domain-containing protein [Ruegeria arenilitoris]